jgi:hypothetical protein
MSMQSRGHVWGYKDDQGESTHFSLLRDRFKGGCKLITKPCIVLCNSKMHFYRICVKDP